MKLKKYCKRTINLQDLAAESTLLREKKNGMRRLLCFTHSPTSYLPTNLLKQIKKILKQRLKCTHWVKLIEVMEKETCIYLFALEYLRSLRQNTQSNFLSVVASVMTIWPLTSLTLASIHTLNFSSNWTASLSWDAFVLSWRSDAWIPPKKTP